MDPVVVRRRQVVGALLVSGLALALLIAGCLVATSGGHATADRSRAPSARSSAVPTMPGGAVDVSSVLHTGQVLHYSAGDPLDLLDVTTPRTPLDPGRSPWVLVVHGGSWIRGRPADMRQSADLLARHGYAAFSVEYPLVNPTTTWRQQFAGLVASWNWIRDHAAELGIDPERGAVWGFSAGGHLAAMLGNRASGVRAVVSLSGVLEPELLARIVEGQDKPLGPTGPDRMLFLHTEHRVVRAPWRPRDRADLAAWREFSPATYLTHSSPPTFVGQGLADSIVPPPTADAYAAQLAAHGVPHEVLLLPGVGHSEIRDTAEAGSAALAWLARYDGPSAGQAP